MDAKPMKLAGIRQTPDDCILRNVDYTQWLQTSETLTDVRFNIEQNTTPPLGITGVTVALPDAQIVQFYVTGGVSGTIYNVTCEVITSLGQTKEDWFTVSVWSPP
jgi:hypothetical protein